MLHLLTNGLSKTSSLFICDLSDDDAATDGGGGAGHVYSSSDSMYGSGDLVHTRACRPILKRKEERKVVHNIHDITDYIAPLGKHTYYV